MLNGLLLMALFGGVGTAMWAILKADENARRKRNPSLPVDEIKNYGKGAQIAAWTVAAIGAVILVTMIINDPASGPMDPEFSYRR